MNKLATLIVIVLVVVLCTAFAPVQHTINNVTNAVLNGASHTNVQVTTMPSSPVMQGMWDTLTSIHDGGN